MPGSGPADLQALAEELLEASIQSLDTIPDFEPTLLGAPDRAFIAPGQPAFDCCDQLTVDVGAIGDAPTAPGGLAAGRRVVNINHVTLVVTITRCVPLPDDRGNPPPPADLEAAAAQMNADAWALWNHLQNLRRADALFTLCGEVFWDGMRPIGPAGQCAGWVLSVRVSFDGYEEAISS